MKKNLVIIEDEENIARAQELILSDSFNVHVAKDGEEGLNKVREIKPELVILDLMLPKMNGIDVCKEIKNDVNLKNTKVVMVTAKNRPADELKGLDIGADDYIMKPFEADELKHVINQVLNE